MAFFKTAAWGHRLRISAMAVAVALIGLTPFEGAEAAQRATFVVGNDRGGYLADRLLEIENLHRNRTPVEIRGRVCYSTCTMFLGLANTCVDPKTTFGFHGPSRSGRKLAPDQFDYFSRVMADYYPTQLKDWFLAKGRYRISGVYKMKGAELIAMGVPACINT